MRIFIVVLSLLLSISAWADSKVFIKNQTLGKLILSYEICDVPLTNQYCEAVTTKPLPAHGTKHVKLKTGEHFHLISAQSTNGRLTGSWEVGQCTHVSNGNRVILVTNVDNANLTCLIGK